ncbi:MAG: hypothetical protein WBG19_05510 [Thermoplasmata archaeon]
MGFRDDDSIRWDGDDVAAFLKFAKGVGAPIIYLSQGILAEDDAGEDREHLGETSYVEASFLVDGQFHNFLEVAEWALEEAADAPLDDREAELAKLATTLESKREELVREFVDDLKKRPGPMETGSFAVENGFRRLVIARLTAPRPGLVPYGFARDGSPFDLLIQKIASDLALELHARQVEEDRATIEPLVAECAEWARKTGLSALSMGDVEVFLTERKVRVAHDGLRLLWMKAKMAVRSARR